jgi:purine nucleosidase
LSIWDLPFEIRRRLIINTDAKNEADDQYAIVHALLSPSLDVRGIVAAHFGFRRGFDSMRQSRQEIDLLVDLLGMKGDIRVEDGAPRPLPDAVTPVDSPGARLIIEEALREDAGPLFIAFLGPLTDMAAALLLEPEIAHRDVTVVWIGGGSYEGFGDGGRVRPEFNLSNDIVAANIVFASDIKVWQVPVSTYQLISVSYAELYREVLGCGELGKYLVEQLIEYNQNNHDRSYSIEWRCLGDSPAIGLVLNSGSGWHDERPAPQFRTDGSYDHTTLYRPIRVYHSIDSRFIIGDLFAKLRAHAEQKTDN